MGPNLISGYFKRPRTAAGYSTDGAQIIADLGSEKGIHTVLLIGDHYLTKTHLGDGKIYVGND